MNLTLELSMKEYNVLRHRLAKEHVGRPSTVLISDVMKREFGFTVRRHHSDDKMVIKLDFYDPAKLTWFRLKYL